MPRLQGLQERLPGRRRRRHLQGRVSFALLRRPPAPAQRLRFRQHRSLGALASMCRAGQSDHATAVAARHFKVRGRNPAQRSIPAFAPRNFQNLVSSIALEARQPPKRRGSARVLLWPDTFNNYFLPDTAKAAVEVLEAAGFRVVSAAGQSLLRPPALRLRHARSRQALLLQILDELSPEIEAGIPMVGLEPSCVAVFRDELINLFPNDERAQKLSPPDFSAQRISGNARHAFSSCRSSSAKPCSTATATTNRS